MRTQTPGEEATLTTNGVGESASLLSGFAFLELSQSWLESQIW